MIDKARFFDGIRNAGLHTTLSHAQVAGYEEILIYWERTCIGVQIEHLAYILATAYHETGGRIEPVREGFAKTDAGAVAAVTKLFKAGRISKNYALPDKRTGKSYYGRGLAQVTHYDNYKRIGERLGRDLVNDPDFLLLLPISVEALVIGMAEGLYTGKKLADYITKDKTDYRGARRIINGTDKAETIAGHAVKFELALREAIT